MSFIKVKVKKRNASQSPAVGFLCSDGAYDTLCVQGYTSLDKCPEVMTAVRIIARTISMMTIKIMENTDQGDKRIINELSRKIDIEPCAYLTRKSWIESIISNLFLYGNGNSVVRVNTNNGLLGDLDPVPASCVSFVPNGTSYWVSINGVYFEPDEVLHFIENPDPYYPWQGRGIKISLKDVTANLKQAAHTEKKFLETPKPNIIVKIDSMIDEFSSPEGRQKLADGYIQSTEDGKPWLIPSEQFSVEQVKPMTLSELAIADNMKLNREFVAAIIGIPAFLLGVGKYSPDAWNHFINTTIKSICIGLEQELTKKLIISPKWHIIFNWTSLLDWDLATISSVYGGLSDRGFVSGNEVRDKIGMSPLPGLDELRVLENYIPFDMAGKQNKLNGGAENG